MKPNELLVESYPPDTGGMRCGLPKGVKATHLPTGNIAICVSERSQHLNKHKALEMLEMSL